MPRVGRKRKKKRTEKDVDVSEKEKRDTPRCFVIKRGNVGQRVKDLVQDFRMVMQPNSAKSLKESKMNRAEDFIAVAGHYGVSHLVIFTTTKQGTYMKLAKLPQGPTLTFKVLSFSLVRSIRAMQKRPRSQSRDFTSAPLQVLNGFGGDGSDGKAAEKTLTAEMLRGLFPAIEVSTFNQSECRRVALFHHDSDKDSVEFRHYSVSRRQTGLQKSISALLNPSRLPKMSSKMDVADFVLGDKGEKADPEAMEADSMSGGKVAVSLTEVGPRLKLQLVKGEEGVLNGAVLFHRFLTRTPTEQEILEQRAKQRRKLKERNDKLDTEARKHNALLKTKRQAKEQAHAAQEKRARGEAPDAAADDEDDGDGESDNKKRRFNPFSFGGKKDATGEKTVEFDSKPSKMKNRRGGTDRRRQGEDTDDPGKGGGKGKGKRGGKGKGKGKGKRSKGD